MMYQSQIRPTSENRLRHSPVFLCWVGLLYGLVLLFFLRFFLVYGEIRGRQQALERTREQFLSFQSQLKLVVGGEKIAPDRADNLKENVRFVQHLLSLFRFSLSRVFMELEEGCARGDFSLRLVSAVFTWKDSSPGLEWIGESENIDSVLALKKAVDGVPIIQSCDLNLYERQADLPLRFQMMLGVKP